MGIGSGLHLGLCPDPELIGGLPSLGRRLHESEGLNRLTSPQVHPPQLQARRQQLRLKTEGSMQGGLGIQPLPVAHQTGPEQVPGMGPAGLLVHGIHKPGHGIGSALMLQSHLAAPVGRAWTGCPIRCLIQGLHDLVEQPTRLQQLQLLLGGCPIAHALSASYHRAWQIYLNLV